MVCQWKPRSILFINRTVINCTFNYRVFGGAFISGKILPINVFFCPTFSIPILVMANQLFNLKVNVIGIFFCTFNLFCSHAIAQNPLFRVDSAYLSRHDIIYNTPAYEGFEGFPLGNGDLGGLVWNTNNGFEFQINKSDLFDKPVI